MKNIKAIVDKAWFALEREALRIGSGNQLLVDALEASRESERSHRRMGRRFTSKGYHCSVETAARYMVLRHAATRVKAPKDWTDAAMTRRDVLFARALRETLISASRYVAAFPDLTFLDISYDSDIAA